jgi:hypothetical protein
MQDTGLTAFELLKHVLTQFGPGEARAECLEDDFPSSMPELLVAVLDNSALFCTVGDFAEVRGELFDLRLRVRIRTVASRVWDMELH